MRRLLAIVVLASSVGAISLLGTGASDDTGSSYLVDVEFRNAFTVIPGLDVKIAGVKVGSVKDLDVTPRQTASVLLEVTEPGFGDWRADAECSIRPQSLIGEKFVECTPTQPRAAGAALPPLLKTRDREGDSVAVLGVDRTRRPVDIDLVNNILRLPYRERLTLIINEFGAGLAGRGEDLDKIIRTADPSLKATDDVLELLAEQDDVLAELASDSDAALAPLARDRARVNSFISQAREVSEATADKRADLERNIQKLPAFLRELRPTMERLGALSDEGAPLLRDFNTVAPDLRRFVAELGPFSEAATPALTTLGEASVVGREALVKSRPIVRDLKDFAGSSKTLARDLRELTESLRDTGGIERLMDYAFYQVAAINGFDQYGHYLRAQLIIDLCTAYSVENDPSCSANFIPPEGATARAASTKFDPDRDPVLARTDAVLRGADPEAINAADRRAAAGGGTSRTAAAAPAPAKAVKAIKMPTQLLPDGGDERAPTPAPAASTSAPSAPAAGPKAATSAPDAGVTSLLDYLMDGGS